MPSWACLELSWAGLKAVLGHLGHFGIRIDDGLHFGFNFGDVLRPKIGPKQVCARYFFLWICFRRLSDYILECFLALLGPSLEARNPKNLQTTGRALRFLCMYVLGYLSYLRLFLEASLAHFELFRPPKWDPQFV